MAVPDHRLGFKGNPRFPGHDGNGFPNPGIPQSADIVVLGDSQSYGVNAALDASWPRRLGKILNARVYNMSFGSYSAAVHLVLLEEALAFKLKIVIEALYTGNDFGEAFLYVYPQEKLSQLRTSDRATQEAIADAESKEPLTEKVSVLFRKGTVEEKPVKQVSGFLLSHSKLFLLLRAGKWKMEDVFCKKEPAWDMEKRKAMNDPQAFQVFEDGNVRTVFCSEARLSVLTKRDPRIREGMRLCHEAIRLMNRRCKENGAVFLVVGIPTKEFVFKDRASGKLANQQTYSGLIENETSAWTDIKEFLDQEGIPFIDCLASLQSFLNDSKQPYSQNTNGHPNAAGYDAIAASVAQSLRTL